MNAHKINTLVSADLDVMHEELIERTPACLAIKAGKEERRSPALSVSEGKSESLEYNPAAILGTFSAKSAERIIKCAQRTDKINLLLKVREINTQK